MNLVPDAPSDAPNYWCTWSLQNYTFGQGEETFNMAELEGARGALHARNNIIEDLLVGENGWANSIFEDIRKDLIVMLDDGWDLPLLQIPVLKNNKNSSIRDLLDSFLNMLHLKKFLSSFHLHSDRFPSARGRSEERLKLLSENMKKLGWKGIGLWVAAQEASNFKLSFDLRRLRYWKERVDWSVYADIRYWKIDWGMKMHIVPFRKLLTSLAKERNIFVEHAHPRSPFNNKFGSGLTSKKYVKHALRLLEFSDVYRTYDVSPQLSIPSTLDRVAKILTNSHEKGSGKQLINCEDEVYIGAALGCAIGIMRHPYRGLRMRNDGKELDFAMPPPRNSKYRIDEVIRAIKWHRIAPPFSSSDLKTKISEEILYDEWLFKSGDFWDKGVLNKIIKQGAPAIVARGIQLPEVKTEGEKPYVISSRNPNGAVSIAMLGRITENKEYYTPRADVTLHLTMDDKVIGIFGFFNSLILQFESSREITEIWAQDLKGDEAIDISGKVRQQNTSIVLSGEILEDIGLKNASEEDISDPGLVINIKGLL